MDMCGIADFLTERAAARGLAAPHRANAYRSQDAANPPPSLACRDSAAWRELAALPDDVLGADHARAGWRPPPGLRGATRLQVIACDASLPAATLARDAIERAAGIPADIASASAIRHRAARLPPGTAIVMLGGSGEAAGMPAARRIAAAQDLPVIRIAPLPALATGQAAAQHGQVLAGPSFAAQAHALLRLGIALGEAAGRGDAAFRKDLAWALASVPVVLAATLARQARLHPLAIRLAAAAEVLLIGRGAGAALAQAGRLDLTQHSGLHAAVLPVAPSAPLLDRPLRRATPVIVCAPSGAELPAALADARALRAQGAHVTVLADANSAPAARVIAEEAGLEMVALPGLGVAGCLAIAVGLRLLALQVAGVQGTSAGHTRHPAHDGVAAWPTAA